MFRIKWTKICLNWEGFTFFLTCSIHLSCVIEKSRTTQLTVRWMRIISTSIHAICYYKSYSFHFFLSSHSGRPLRLSWNLCYPKMIFWVMIAMNIADVQTCANIFQVQQWLLIPSQWYDADIVNVLCWNRESNRVCVRWFTMWQSSRESCLRQKSFCGLIMVMQVASSSQGNVNIHGRSSRLIQLTF